jgi:ABC-2 type transport system ATP-binding protein
MRRFVPSETRPRDDAATPSSYLASSHDLPPARPLDRVDRRDLAVDDAADAPPTPCHPYPKDVLPVITIDSLTKKYGGTTVVHDISFSALPGRVTGFLGPNGAGKSTSMRMMVGLTTPTEGSVTISGRHFADLPNPGREVGVMLDASAQHAGRTGREILTIAQQIMDVPATRVAELLELVSLTPAEADRRVGNYSLGMRQRLGIAAALIGDPSVLILDEPANGLDPAGIRWMRDLLRDYADHGGTVLLSSHLLSEVEIIADDIVMIGQGRIVCQGSKSELLQAAGTVVRAPDVVALQRALAAAGLVATVSEDGSVRTEADTTSVGRAAYHGGVMLTELRAAESGGLEEMFLELTADTQRERTAA